MIVDDVFNGRDGKKDLFLVLVICMPLFAGILGGCLGGEEEKPHETIWTTSVYTLPGISGKCTNPDVDSSGSEYQTNLTINISNGSYPCGILAVLTWTDDHAGTDSNDVYDTFTLTFSANGTTQTVSGNNGSISLSIGYTSGLSGGSGGNNSTGGKTSGNATGSGGGTSGKGEPPKQIALNWTITVAISDCGTYGAFRPNGFLRYYDEGNSFKLDLQALMVSVS